MSLESAGHGMSAAAYSEIEAGTTFPRDARLFLDTVSDCLELDKLERWEPCSAVVRRQGAGGLEPTR